MSTGVVVIPDIYGSMVVVVVLFLCCSSGMGAGFMNVTMQSCGGL